MPKLYAIEVPSIVQTAKRAAIELGFDLRPEGNPAGRCPSGTSACLDEVGSLLRTLTASLPNGRIGEVGTGAGVGTAWIVAGLAATASLTTIEVDANLSAAARDLFAARANVEVITGDWRDVISRHAPFDLLFFDGGGPGALKPDNWQMLAHAMAPSGMMVLDDLTPEEQWPPHWRGKADPKRELAFRSGLFVATEIRTRANAAALLLVKASATA